MQMARDGRPGGTAHSREPIVMAPVIHPIESNLGRCTHCKIAVVDQLGPALRTGTKVERSPGELRGLMGQACKINVRADTEFRHECLYTSLLPYSC